MDTYLRAGLAHTVQSGGGYTLTGGFWGGAAPEYRIYLPVVVRQ